ncbi:MAG: hypothetical protein ACTSQK_10375 [Candidatus Heimdallarchaeota archaeon]
MADIPQDPKLGSIIILGFVLIAVFTVVTMLFAKYLDRKKEPALTLAITFLFWGLSGIAVFIGFILHYINIPIPAGDIQYSRYGINLGYLFSAVSNMFMVLFISQIFSQAPMFRRTKKTIPLVNAILNGITIGLIINTISLSLNAVDPTEIYNPQYPIAQTIYHLVLTFFSFTLLLALSFKERKEASLRWERAGFTFIILYGVSGILIYVMFVLDLIFPLIWSEIFGLGYTIFNYLGWVFAILMCIFAYLGYAMPTRIRNLLKEPEVS